MLHFLTSLFFALLVVLLAWPGHLVATLCVFIVAAIFMALLLEMLAHHLQVMLRVPRDVAEPVRVREAPAAHGLHSGDM